MEENIYIADFFFRKSGLFRARAPRTLQRKKSSVPNKRDEAYSAVPP